MSTLSGTPGWCSHPWQVGGQGGWGGGWVSEVQQGVGQSTYTDTASTLPDTRGWRGRPWRARVSAASAGGQRRGARPSSWPSALACRCARPPGAGTAAA